MAALKKFFHTEFSSVSALYRFVDDDDVILETERVNFSFDISDLKSSTVTSALFLSCKSSISFF